MVLSLPAIEAAGQRRQAVEIDARRWQALLAEERDAGFLLRGSTTQLNEAQFAALKARSARDRAAGDRALGYRDDAIVAGRTKSRRI